MPKSAEFPGAEMRRLLQRNAVRTVGLIASFVYVWMSRESLR